MPHNTYSERRKAQLQARHPSPSEKGYFVSPTVFDGVSSEMSIAREEINTALDLMRRDESIRSVINF